MDKVYSKMMFLFSNYLLKNCDEEYRESYQKQISSIITSISIFLTLTATSLMISLLINSNVGSFVHCYSVVISTAIMTFKSFYKTADNIVSKLDDTAEILVQKYVEGPYQKYISFKKSFNKTVEDIKGQVNELQKNLNQLEEWRIKTVDSLEKITHFVQENSQKVQDLANKLLSVEQKCEKAIDVANENVKKKLDPIKSEIDQKLDMIKKFYSGEIINTNQVEDKVYKPLNTTKAKLDNIEAKLEKLKELITLVQSANSKLIQFNEILKNNALPNVDEEFKSAMGKMNQFTASVDAIMKQIREIPDKIIADINKQYNIYINAIVAVMTAYYLYTYAPIIVEMVYVLLGQISITQFFADAAQAIRVLGSLLNMLQVIIVKIIMIKIDITFNKQYIELKLEDTIKTETNKYKQQLQEKIDKTIEEVCGGNKALEDTLKKTVGDILNNLENPKKMRQDLENTVNNELYNLLTQVVKKYIGQLQDEKDSMIAKKKKELEDQRDQEIEKCKQMLQKRKDMLEQQKDEFIAEKKKELQNYLEEKLKELAMQLLEHMKEKAKQAAADKLQEEINEIESEVDETEGEIKKILDQAQDVWNTLDKMRTAVDSMKKAEDLSKGADKLKDLGGELGGGLNKLGGSLF